MFQLRYIFGAVALGSVILAVNVRSDRHPMKRNHLMAAALVIVALVGCATHAADGSWVVTRIATAEGDLVEAESSFLLEFHDVQLFLMESYKDASL